MHQQQDEQIRAFVAHITSTADMWGIALQLSAAVERVSDTETM